MTPDATVGGRPWHTLVRDCEIAYERWPRQGAPPLVLVHGGHAHGGWWSGVVDHLRDRADLTVPDLSGHGDSGHRAEYRPELWAEELAAVITAVGNGPVTVVGHSMGGRVGVYLAARWPDVVRRLVLIDSSLRRPGSRPEPSPPARHVPKRVYPTPEAALRRFRLRPPESTADPALLECVARRAITRVSGGWTWKFDPRVVSRFTDSAQHTELVRVRCPVALLYGEHSAMTRCGTHPYLEEALGRPVPRVAVPAAYHHVPLDAPRDCASALEALLDVPGHSRCRPE